MINFHPLPGWLVLVFGLLVPTSDLFFVFLFFVDTSIAPSPAHHTPAASTTGEEQRIVRSVGFTTLDFEFSSCKLSQAQAQAYSWAYFFCFFPQRQQ